MLMFSIRILFKRYSIIQVCGFKPGRSCWIFRT